jgi:hypothetical protein
VQLQSPVLALLCAVPLVARADASSGVLGGAVR